MQKAIDAIWSTRYEKLAGGFEPIGNGEIF